MAAGLLMPMLISWPVTWARLGTVAAGPASKQP
jgi:hypothetical protein